MRRRTRNVLAPIVLAASLVCLSGCGGRADGGNPGNPAGDVTTTIPGPTTIPSG